MSNSRIPRKVTDFSPYLHNTANYLATTNSAMVLATASNADNSEPLPVTNWQRLGLLETEYSTWIAFVQEWDVLYPKYTQKKETRTTSIKDQLMKVQKDFIDFAQPLLNRIQYSPNVITQDFEVFNIKGGSLRDDVPSRPHTPIEAEVKFSMTPMGGAKIKFSCNDIEESKRASILNEADGVEVVYKTGDTPPNNYSECPQNYISTKAIFVLSLPAEDESKKIYAFCRWIVLSDPARNGPFGGMQRVVVA